MSAGRVRMGTASSLILGLLLVGCAQLANPPTNSAPPAATGHTASAAETLALVQTDIAAVANLQMNQVAQFDREHSNAFTEIFGGESGADVLNYFNARIKYFVADSDAIYSNVDMDKFPYQGWLTSMNMPTEATADLVSPLAATSNAKLGGQNIGTEYWFISIINRTPFSLFVNGQTLPVTSSRLGLMKLGEAYATSLRNSHGQSVNLPIAYRQGILMHEARHSDCTGGVTEADLDVARNAQSMAEFTTAFPKMECGHFHTICPSDMPDVGGLAACDDRPWGAYTVGFIFQKAIWETMPDGSEDKAILEASAIDSFSRLKFDTDDMLSGADGPPNMTTSGLADGGVL